MSDIGIYFFICNIFICLFIGALTGIKRLAKKHISARIQYDLWSILLLLLAVPFLPAGVSDLLRIPSWLCLLHKVQTPDTSAVKNLVPAEHDTAIGRINDLAVSVGSQTPSFIGTVFLILWIAGVCVMTVSAFCSWKRLRNIKRSALPLQDPRVRDIFQACLDETGIKRKIAVYSTAFLRSPIAAGLCRPCIYVPIHLISDLDPQEMRFVFLHELQHHRSGDILAGYFMDLARILYWFDPVVLYALKEMRCDREIACDSAVLHMLRETDYAAYGHTLIDFAEKISRSRCPFAIGIGGSIRQMERRILHIADFKKDTLSRKTKGILIYILTIALLMGYAPLLFVYAPVPDDHRLNASGPISYMDLSDSFGRYDGSFVLYDTDADRWSIYNMKAAGKRVSPASTYKIYAALLGLGSGIITADHSHMAWDGTEQPFDQWETDQDLDSAMRGSVNWYFQAIDAQIGAAPIKTFLKTIGYGNQRIGTDLGLYWTDSSLKISPLEQVELLKRFHDNSLQMAPQNIDAVKDALRLSSSPDGSLYGKTGTGCVDGRDVNGWFIGYVEKPGNVYYFAANIQGREKADGSRAAAIAQSVLSDLDIWDP